MDANLTAQFASNVQQSQVKNDVAFAVASKSLKAQKQQGEAAVDLVKQVADLSSQLAQGKIDVQL